MDNDGDLDMAVGSSDGTVKYYKNTGSVTAPTFVEQTGADNIFSLSGLDAARNAAVPACYDFDADGV